MLCIKKKLRETNSSYSIDFDISHVERFVRPEIIWLAYFLHMFANLSVICLGDGKCVICDSYVRPCTLVRICDECNYGSYQGRCVICGGPGVSDAYYCKECTIVEKDVSALWCSLLLPHSIIYKIFFVCFTLVCQFVVRFQCFLVLLNIFL